MISQTQLEQLERRALMRSDDPRWERIVDQFLGRFACGGGSPGDCRSLGDLRDWVRIAAKMRPRFTDAGEMSVELPAPIVLSVSPAYVEKVLTQWAEQFTRELEWGARSP